MKRKLYSIFISLLEITWSILRDLRLTKIANYILEIETKYSVRLANMPLNLIPGTGKSKSWW